MIYDTVILALQNLDCCSFLSQTVPVAGSTKPAEFSGTENRSNILLSTTPELILAFASTPVHAKTALICYGDPSAGRTLHPGKPSFLLLPAEPFPHLWLETTVWQRMSPRVCQIRLGSCSITFKRIQQRSTPFSSYITLWVSVLIRWWSWSKSIPGSVIISAACDQPTNHNTTQRCGPRRLSVDIGSFGTTGHSGGARNYYGPGKLERNIYEAEFVLIQLHSFICVSLPPAASLSFKSEQCDMWHVELTS